MVMSDRSGQVEGGGRGPGRGAGSGASHLEAVRALVRSQHQTPGLLQRVDVAVFDQHAPGVQRLCSQRSTTGQSGPDAAAAFYNGALTSEGHAGITLFPWRQLRFNHLQPSLADAAADFKFFFPASKLPRIQQGLLR